jgi:predicted ATP-dependent endonuclease of OLD family
MRIDFVEIRNFRRLAAIRIDFSKKTTLLVGANNSGKTSAIVALRNFLIHQNAFSPYDIPLAHWALIDELGNACETGAPEELDNKWRELLPSVDVWLEVAEREIHHVAHLIPTLDWKPEEGVGVRFQLEPGKPDEVIKAYLKAKKAASDTLGTKQPGETQEQKARETTRGGSTRRKFSLWPESLMDFLKKRMSSFLGVNAYLLDPAKKTLPRDGAAQPQELPNEVEPLDGNPFKGLIRIDEVPAHRGFSDYSGTPWDADTPDQEEKGRGQLLTAQLRVYYGKHLDPLKAPEPSDIRALEAIHEAQAAFDERLKDCFKTPLCELEQLGYPGVANPRLIISTSLRPVEGLRHQSAVQYDVVRAHPKNEVSPCRLPEQCNGLGYQNLISMVFLLISFRDDWMKVGKAARTEEETGTRPPLHLVLLEEPEAHLHVQVQQVFIRKAYDVLRNHQDLRGDSPLSTQLVISTHSCHIAHEVDFADMRYFRRHPAWRPGETPTSTVVNLSEIFGSPDETAKFVSRYLQATHVDLFFADGAILVEGAAERMLIPHFIRSHYGNLHSCYITLLEVGGSHAHRLEPLIRHLGLNTLVITDIDAINQLTRKRELPRSGAGLVTANNVLKGWHPKKESLDDLLKLEEGEKEKHYDDCFSIRVAYQTFVQVSSGNGAQSAAAPRTFEDALALVNIEFFRNSKGLGLVKKFREAVESNDDISKVHEALLNALNTATKAEFALDMLYSEEPSLIKVPEYIRNGLEWLEGKLLQRQQEVLVSQTGNTQELEGSAK